MKLSVPFVYIAQIIKPKYRKPVDVYIKDTVEVEIREFDQVPVAFTSKSIHNGYTVENHWLDNKLWTINWHTSNSRTTKTKSKTIFNNTKNINVDMVHSANTKAPFKNFWRKINYMSRVLLRDASHKDDIVYRDLISDNRQEVINKAIKIASNIIFIQDISYSPTPEPAYEIMTFGSGYNNNMNNNCGKDTILTTCHINNQFYSTKNYFTINEAEKAIEYANFVALRRGDTKSTPVKPDVTFTIYIPEAIQGKSTISLAESIINEKSRFIEKITTFSEDFCLSAFEYIFKTETKYDLPVIKCAFEKYFKDMPYEEFIIYSKVVYNHSLHSLSA
jgi:hypothetical protein